MGILLHRFATQRPSPRSGRVCRRQQARRTRLRAYEADEPGRGRSGYVYCDLQGRPIAREEARRRVQNEFPGPTAIRRMAAARPDASPTIPSNKARRPSPAYARPSGSDASSSGYGTQTEISDLIDHKDVGVEVVVEGGGKPSGTSGVGEFLDELSGGAEAGLEAVLYGPICDGNFFGP